MTELVIEAMRHRDLRRVVEIEKDLFPDPWSLALLRSELDAGPSRRYTKAVVAGQIVGYLGLMFVEDEVHVNTLGVSTRSQGLGMASRLLLDGFEAALDRGARHGTLEVAVSNEPAKALDRRFGLAPVGVRRGYYGRGEDALVMWVRDIGSEAEMARRAAIAESLGSIS